MKIDYFGSCKLLELFNGAYANDLFSVFWDPEGNGVAPKPISWKAPIFSVFEPVIKLFLLDGFGNPIGLMIVLYKILSYLSDLNKPRRHSFVNEWGLASPAKWIVMLQNTLFKQPSSLLQIFHYELICCFYVNPLKLWNLFGKAPIIVHWNRRIVRFYQLFFHAHFVIILAEPRSAMDNSCSIGVCYKSSDLDCKASIFGPFIKIVI